MIIVRPPQAWPSAGRKIFLAGSIEMNLAAPWQDEVAAALQDTDWVLLNPRRLDWDSSLRQDIDEPAFKEQVLWELQGLEESEAIVCYFDPNTKSPITLLELGLQARSGKLIVCCPAGFWRRGNVAIVCERYDVPMVDDLASLVAALRLKMS
jgi:Nucleoside 2-deoxyribosyltransferase like